MTISSLSGRQKTIARIVVFALALLGALALLSFLAPVKTNAMGILPEAISLPDMFENSVTEVTGQTGTATTLQLVFLIVLISLAPSLLLVMTSFSRIIIVLHFLRSALGTQQMPPNQVLIGLALFLTIFNMSGVFAEVNEQAIQPLTRQEITQDEAITAALAPMRMYMFEQSEMKELQLFSSIAGYEVYGSTKDEIRDDIIENMPTSVLIPAFVLGEIAKGFLIGFVIYIPFIVIDMVVASTLMAMGMMMLPPAMISLPFKIMLFLLADGWTLVIQSLMSSFRGG